MKSLIFTTSMVPALLDGRKTRTSRIIKPQPRAGTSDFSFCKILDGFPKNKLNRPGLFFKAPKNEWIDTDMPFHEFIPAPLVVGDIFYAKETWGIGPRDGDVLYAADSQWQIDSLSVPPSGMLSWKSPLLMPEWASRFKGEIVGVKAQRIREISAADAIREGIIINGEMMDPCDIASEAKDRFHELWDSLHGAGAWDANSYIWAYDFRRVEEGGK